MVYDIEGSGKPVVLIHGFGETRSIWARQVEFLKDRYRLIVPDLPGSGESEMQDDMSIEGMANSVKAIMDAEGTVVPGSGFTVIGHSMGGYITLALAEKHDAELAAFGLFHSSAFADSEEKVAARRKSIGFIREHGAHSFLETATPKLFATASLEKYKTIIDELIEDGHNFSADALVSYYESMIKRPDRTDVLKKAKVPVLFVMGEHDSAIPLADGLKQCHLPERADINILHDSGHMGMLEETGKSNLILEKFLEGP